MTTLLATFRYDGAVLLELLADWYHVLATAETDVADTETNDRILAAWAADEIRQQPARPRRLRGPYLIRWAPEALERDYARGLAVPMGEGAGARDLTRVFARARAKAEERLAGGAYLSVLGGYLERLRGMGDDPRAYRRVEHTIAEIVADERYLRVAADARARELVAAIDDELGRLYGRCMDVER